MGVSNDGDGGLAKGGASVNVEVHLPEIDRAIRSLLDSKIAVLQASEESSATEQAILERRSNSCWNIGRSEGEGENGGKGKGRVREGKERGEEEESIHPRCIPC